MSKYGKDEQDERDQQMIQTPWGKKRWRTIRLAFEQRDELLEALRMFIALDPRCHHGVTSCGECAVCKGAAAIAKAETE